MYFSLVSAIKRRLVLELQDAFSRHPVYEKLVPYIQNKFSFDERPQFGIVVKGSSANTVKLSSDNFLGVVESHVMLTGLDAPAYMLEWVREDTATINQQGGMPCLPGVYYMECIKAPTNPNEAGALMIDPLLTVTDEPVLYMQSGIEGYARLKNRPSKRAVRLWENRNYLLVEGQDYDLNYGTGEIRFKTRFSPHSVITADYRYPVDSIGPLEFYWNRANSNVLPGVVLAFGKRAKVGDKVAVVVTEDRVDTANAYGGKTELNFDLDVISQDPFQLEEIVDFAVMSLWAEKRASLAFEGIEILDVSMGGEAEEVYDETADTYSYTGSLSIQVQADWEVHLPLPLTIKKVVAEYPSDAGVSTDSRASSTGSLNLVRGGGLFLGTAPILVGRNHAYEKIT